jgi:hypothetical protein
MSLPSKPFADPQRDVRAPEHLDNLLTRFFRAELPAPWPQLVLPAEPQTNAKRPLSGRQPLPRSRFALAASLLLLLLGQVCLSSLYSDNNAVLPELSPAKFEATNRDRPVHPSLPKSQPKAESTKHRAEPSKARP